MWLRRMVREEIGDLIAEAAATQVGGYDGVHESVEDDYADESKRAKPGATSRPIGFHVVAAMARAQMRKR